MRTPRFLVGAAAAVACLGRLPARALPADDAPPILAFDARMEPATVRLGEPIVLRYTITNVSRTSVDVGWNGEWAGHSARLPENPPPWLSISFVGPQERGLSRQEDMRQQVTRIAQPALRREPPPVLLPGQSREGELVLSQWFAPSEPGRYRILLRAELACQPRLSYAVGSPPLRAAPDLVRAERVLALEVRPNTPMRLLRVARSLRDEALEAAAGTKVADRERAMFAIRKLFAMPEPLVLPVWRELALDPALDPALAAYAVSEMWRIASPNAESLIDALRAEGRWRPFG